ncbi:hypothetical protein [Sphingomonas psychrotolerans]|uniref:Uncharacterized protein n=1 Tax=Sphingomonas psychrotolerans TaxID=1327635 RepID=A0A2K8MAS4_9SPHN|nr:hypothetical protein [Sphingomonas psychrotolerans]ATY30988.1 hypothetical protein CVN68_02460 [Sphingomonas psychrotolerans]
MRRLTKIVFAPLMLGLAAAPTGARIAFVPPQMVGPPGLVLDPACPIMVAPSGGTTPGAEIPVRGLALGAPVQRSATSFPTGGSGTANAMERERRRKAGLPYEPRIYDPAGSERPAVFAVGMRQPPTAWLYQRLLLKPSGAAYPRYGLVFAQATSPTAGRIASLALVRPTRPAARPKMSISGGYRLREGCQREEPVHVYAPAMSVGQIRKLFARSGCSWTNLSACSRSQWPRGRVLFVQMQRSGAGYEHRWIDYDLLAGGGNLENSRKRFGIILI